VISLTRRYRFCASHRLHSPSLSEAQNQALYGKCNNPHGHGHDYVLEVSAAGPVDAKSGQAVRVVALDHLVRSNVIEQFDHRSLNHDVASMADIVPTTENLATEIRRILQSAWLSAFPTGQPKLAGVALFETKKNSVQIKP
jgi:6-pyruvoyltetrahydropterin/6-carboxytetrahydropterin synthase